MGSDLHDASSKSHSRRFQPLSDDDEEEEDVLPRTKTREAISSKMPEPEKASSKKKRTVSKASKSQADDDEEKSKIKFSDAAAAALLDLIILSSSENGSDILEKRHLSAKSVDKAGRMILAEWISSDGNPCRLSEASFQKAQERVGCRLIEQIMAVDKRSSGTAGKRDGTNSQTQYLPRSRV